MLFFVSSARLPTRVIRSTTDVIPGLRSSAKSRYRPVQHFPITEPPTSFRLLKAHTYRFLDEPKYSFNHSSLPPSILIFVDQTFARERSRVYSALSASADHRAAFMCTLPDIKSFEKIKDTSKDELLEERKLARKIIQAGWTWARWPDRGSHSSAWDQQDLCNDETTHRTLNLALLKSMDQDPTLDNIPLLFLVSDREFYRQLQRIKLRRAVLVPGKDLQKVCSMVRETCQPTSPDPSRFNVSSESARKPNPGIKFLFLDSTMIIRPTVPLHLIDAVATSLQLRVIILPQVYKECRWPETRQTLREAIETFGWIFYPIDWVKRRTLIDQPDQLVAGDVSIRGQAMDILLTKRKSGILLTTDVAQGLICRMVRSPSKGEYERNKPVHACLFDAVLNRRGINGMPTTEHQLRHVLTSVLEQNKIEQASSKLQDIDIASKVRHNGT